MTKSFDPHQRQCASCGRDAEVLYFMDGDPIGTAICSLCASEADEVADLEAAIQTGTMHYFLTEQ